jgi:RNA polymerase sigma factor (sigma-70 family)
MVLGVCRRMLGNAAAEDAAQAVFVLYWQKAMHLQDEARIAGWLHRTAQHVCRNASRSRALRSRREREAAAESLAMSTEPSVSSQWIEIREILDLEIDCLPISLRLAFVLFHCEQRSLNDVAAIMRASVSTVGTWLQRARERLAQRLRRRGVAISAAALLAVLSTQVAAEAVPTTFVSATLQTASLASSAGLTACGPTVAALVQAGSAGLASKIWWIALAAGALTLGIPLLEGWFLPVLQTRWSPDFPQLQGHWQEVSTEQDGAEMNMPSAVDYEGSLRIDGRRFHHYQTLADGRVLEGGRGYFILDSSPTPAAIDFFQGPRAAHGIYELDGETMTLCVTRNSGTRPDKLVTRQGDDRILTRYKRVP